MQSLNPRKRYPSKTIVVNNNTTSFQSEDNPKRRPKQLRTSKQIKRCNILERQELKQANQFPANLKRISDSESDSDVSIQKSIQSGSSDSSVNSVKTIKSHSSSRMRRNLNQQTQDVFSKTIRQTKSQKDTQKEEIQQKLFDKMVDKGTLNNYLLNQEIEQFDSTIKRRNQYQKNSKNQELSEIFSSPQNDDNQSNASAQQKEKQDLQIVQQQNENFCFSPQFSMQTPMAEISSTYLCPRVSDLHLSLDGFGPSSINSQSQSSIAVIKQQFINRLLISYKTCPNNMRKFVKEQIVMMAHNLQNIENSKVLKNII
ncbi:unnamed protein product (macronuclear) [Paramecium tetraurelia]|uniref:Uncharacterized protein n=1 Tax=Paramecium tetraurelia TaxID=5888 RepID=A0BWK9_PARTE|nr:uncharacterized protein GSPATT00032778001 [Paramecium tetraurelia]CAK62926.1 unnamed protein product [Paramecium tetraurelia]|eukprot:XP_001430324.1 hypothetical protein (macronuclear) [Paramecium tetraurelia strain d4-2]